MKTVKQAIILAAGEGQRLRPFTVNKPKPMLSIAGKPILQYVIEALVQNGIRRIVLVVGYRREQILNYVGSGSKFGAEITYINQEKQLGTAHALEQVKEVADNEFLVLSGDDMIEEDTITRFCMVPADALLVKRAENTARYGVVTMSGGMVQGITEKLVEAKSDIVNTGIYSFTREIFSFTKNHLDIPDAINDMLAEGRPISAEETTGTWLDVAYPWDILNLNAAALDGIQSEMRGAIDQWVLLKDKVMVGSDTVIRASSYVAGPVIIGNNCEIGPSTCILSNTSIGDNVVISPFSSIKNSIIGNDVNIGPGCVIQDSIIDSGCTIKGHFTAYSGEADIRFNGYSPTNIGIMMGEDCTIGNNVVAQPGVILGNHSQVQSLKLLSGQLPDRSLVF
ncbi:bifunctional sugar-1-phosphate nucleotidylyltransferase/acetyltransferase [Chloroflexota bacterium]